MFAEGLFHRISQHLFRSIIPAHHMAVQIDGNDGFLDLIDNGGLPSYHLNRLFSCGDVGPEADDFLWGSVQSTDQHRLVPEPAVLATLCLPAVFGRQCDTKKQLLKFHQYSVVVEGMKSRGPQG